LHISKHKQAPFGSNRMVKQPNTAWLHSSKPLIISELMNISKILHIKVPTDGEFVVTL